MTLENSCRSIFKFLSLRYKGQKCILYKIVEHNDVSQWQKKKELLPAEIAGRNHWQAISYLHKSTHALSPIKTREMTPTDMKKLLFSAAAVHGSVRSRAEFSLLLFFLISLISRHTFRHLQKANPIKQHCAKLATSKKVGWLVISFTPARMLNFPGMIVLSR